MQKCVYVVGDCENPGHIENWVNYDSHVVDTLTESSILSDGTLVVLKVEEAPVCPNFGMRPSYRGY